MALASGLGVALAAPAGPAVATLFGEDQARYLIATPDPQGVLAAAADAGVPAAVAGKATGSALSVDGLFSIELDALRAANEAFLPALMGA
jgi:phosphoribosylformylglycinamidine synthase